MTKTLAAVAIIIISGLMAWGIREVARRNEATSTMSNAQYPILNEVPITNNQETNKMELEISSPEGVVNNKKITLTGKTAPNAEVQVDDKELDADEDGEFETELDLDEGENEIMVTANDENGEYAKKSIKVTYEPTE